MMQGKWMKESWLMGGNKIHTEQPVNMKGWLRAPGIVYLHLHVATSVFPSPSLFHNGWKLGPLIVFHFGNVIIVDFWWNGFVASSLRTAYVWEARQQVTFSSVGMNVCLMGFFKWSECSQYRATQGEHMLRVNESSTCGGGWEGGGLPCLLPERKHKRLHTLPFCILWIAGCLLYLSVCRCAWRCSALPMVWDR